MEACGDLELLLKSHLGVQGMSTYKEEADVRKHPDSIVDASSSDPYPYQSHLRMVWIE